MLIDSSWCKRRRPYVRRFLVLLAFLPVVTLALAACESKDASDYTPPPATIIRASDTITPIPTTDEGAATPPAREKPAATRPEDYPAPATTPSLHVTPEGYPSKAK